MKFGRKQILSYITNHLISQVLFSRVRLFWYRRVMKFVIGVHTSILTDLRVSTMSNMKVGDHTVINNGCRFDNRFPITIGNNVSITYGTIIYTKGHDIDDPYFGTKGAPVTIDDYAWICANVIILPGVHVGKGAVVLPGSVVTQDVKPYHVVGGNPAKFIRKRSTDLRYELDWDPWFPFFG
jgi:maltose O-acetyltransferase